MQKIVWWSLLTTLTVLPTHALANTLNSNMGDSNVAAGLGFAAFFTIVILGYAGLARFVPLQLTNGNKHALHVLREFAWFLAFGTVVAIGWANLAPENYYATVHYVFWDGFGLDWNLHMIVNDAFMCFFFGIAAKELTEALFKNNGALCGDNVWLPGFATVGGVVAPIIVYLLLCTPELRGAWAVPCATDIAFAWLGARIMWGARHPMTLTLLALSVLDDFVGMVIIALCYPQREISVEGIATGLTLIIAGVIIARYMSRKGMRYWPLYILAAIPVWWGLHTAGLHAALALVFTVPFMPMCNDEDGTLFNEADDVHDTLNTYEHHTRPFVDIGLSFFGLVNAGVNLSTGLDQNSMAVFLALGIGKTVGITACMLLGYHWLHTHGKLRAFPSNEHGAINPWHIPIMGNMAGVGFTVSLFIASAAGDFPSLKAGALASFLWLLTAIIIGKVLVRQ